jgi:hypothetical protein
MNDKREPDPHPEAPRPAQGEAEYVKEREQKDDGRYIIFYSFGAEEDD